MSGIGESFKSPAHFVSARAASFTGTCLHDGVEVAEEMLQQVVAAAAELLHGAIVIKLGRAMQPSSGCRKITLHAGAVLVDHRKHVRGVDVSGFSSVRQQGYGSIR